MRRYNIRVYNGVRLFDLLLYEDGRIELEFKLPHSKPIRVSLTLVIQQIRMAAGENVI